MIRFKVQPDELIAQKQELFEQESETEVETAAEPLDESNDDFAELAGERHGAGRKIKVLRRRKLTDWLTDVGETISHIPGNTATFLKEKVADKVAPGLIEYTRGKYENIRDSVPVKFIEDTGFGERARLFMFEHGPSSRLEPKIEKLKGELVVLKQRQQQEAYEFNRVTEQFESQDIKITKAKKDKTEYWDGRIKIIEDKIKELEELLANRTAEMTRLSDGLNNKIDNKISRIKRDSNFEAMEDEHEELRDALISTEKEQAKAKEKFEQLMEVNRQLLDGSNYKRSVDDIFDTERIKKDEEKLSDEQKQKKKGARDSIEKSHTKDKLSLKNILEMNLLALQRQRKELEILESNINKLRKSKDKVDAKLIKTQHRVESWNLQRKVIGVDKENNKIGKGEFVKEQPISRDSIDEVVEGAIKQTDALFDTDNPSQWFTAEAIAKCPVDGIDASLNEELVAKGLAEMRQTAERAVFTMEGAIANYIVPEIPKFEEEIKNLQGEKAQVESALSALRSNNKGNKNKAEIQKKEGELQVINAELSARQDVPQKLRDLQTKFEADIARLKADFLPKLSEDITSKQRTWTEYKAELYKMFPALQQYEVQFTNKNKFPDLPGMPDAQTQSPDFVDTASEKIINEAIVHAGADGIALYEELMTSLADIESDAAIPNADQKKQVAEVVLAFAVDTLIKEHSPESIERASALLMAIAERSYGEGESKRLVHFLGEYFATGHSDDAKLFEEFANFKGAMGESLSKGKISQELVDATVRKVFNGLKSTIDAEEGKISNKARDMADLASKIIKANDDSLISEDVSSEMFSSVVTYLNQVPQFTSESYDPEGEDLAELLGENQISINAEYSKTLSYVHQVFMETGVSGPIGMTLEQMNKRTETLLEREKTDPKNPAHFPHIFKFIDELAKASDVDRASTLIARAQELVKDDPFKSFELAETIRNTGNPDVQHFVYDISDTLFDGADATPDGLFWKVRSLDLIAGPLSKTEEGAESELEKKCDALFASCGESPRRLSDLYKAVLEGEQAFTESNARKNLVVKIFASMEGVVKAMKNDDTRINNLYIIASFMENEGMADEADRLKKEAIADRDAVTARERAQRQAEIDAQGPEDQGYLNEIDEDAGSSVESSYGDDIFAPSASDSTGTAPGSYAQSSNPLRPVAGMGQGQPPKKKGFFARLFGGLFSFGRRSNNNQ